MSFKRPGRRAGHVYVSSSLSKIPYVGFSPVRLQTDLQPRSSPVVVEPRPAYTWPTVQALCPCDPFGYVCRGVCSGRVGPEALGSPVGYVVPSGHRLLWPHPSLSVSPVDLCIRQQVFVFRRRSRGSPIYSACPSPRATSRTPADRASCNWLFLRAPIVAFALFAWARHPHIHTSRFTCGRVTGLQSSLNAAARGVACPSPTRTFTIELSLHESPHWNVDYNYAGKQPIPTAGLSPAGHAALWAADEEQ